MDHRRRSARRIPELAALAWPDDGIYLELDTDDDGGAGRSDDVGDGEGESDALVSGETDDTLFGDPD